MVERLLRAFQQLAELSPAAQLDLAQQIEDLTDPHDEMATLQETAPHEPAAAAAPLPPSVRAVLAFAGAWSDLQGADEFAALARTRHACIPTPPMDDHLA
jgi:hypothetical protein